MGSLPTSLWVPTRKEGLVHAALAAKNEFETLKAKVNFRLLKNVS